MSRRRNALTMLAAIALAACDALDPYPTAPAAAPTPLAGANGAAPRVAICYNPVHTALGAVQEEAQQECTAGNPRNLAVPAETDWYLQNCPLLLPARANFVCAPAKT